MTYAEAAATFDYNQQTGVLTWKRGRRAGKKAGTNHGDGYLTVEVRGVAYYVHRLAWLLATGYEPQNQIDHINRDRSDNRLVNLRDVTRSVNLQNSKTFVTNKCGRKCVQYHGQSGKWRARITLNGRRFSLGLHDTADAAHEAYVRAKARMHDVPTQEIGL